ncbi:MAG: hypothetical protein EPN41_15250 [Candidimonas sp.]|nr:MAG: hypothetical protein EPN41_15250 [Candidimonas sp.]
MVNVYHPVSKRNVAKTNEQTDYRTTKQGDNREKGFLDEFRHLLGSNAAIDLISFRRQCARRVRGKQEGLITPAAVG